MLSDILDLLKKIHEELINETQSMYTYQNGQYYHIRSSFDDSDINLDTYTISSDQCILSKETLKNYLQNMDFL